jgi:hypothetical protein
MANIFDFDTNSFLALPVKERISLCKRCAERAQQLAAPRLARDWLRPGVIPILRVSRVRGPGLRTR